MLKITLKEKSIINITDIDSTVPIFVKNKNNKLIGMVVQQECGNDGYFYMVQIDELETFGRHKTLKELIEAYSEHTFHIEQQGE